MGGRKLKGTVGRAGGSIRTGVRKPKNTHLDRPEEKTHDLQPTLYSEYVRAAMNATTTAVVGS